MGSGNVGKWTVSASVVSAATMALPWVTRSSWEVACRYCTDGIRRPTACSDRAPFGDTATVYCPPPSTGVKDRLSWMNSHQLGTLYVSLVLVRPCPDTITDACHAGSVARASGVSPAMRVNSDARPVGAV